MNAFSVIATAALLVGAFTSIAPLFYAVMTGKFCEQVHSPPIRIKDRPARFARFAIFDAVMGGFCVVGLCRVFGIF